MGEHKRNRQAIVRAMLPSFPPGVNYTTVDLRGGFTIRRGLLIVPPEDIRKAEDGTTEIKWQNGEATEWAKPPEGSEVVPEGTKLGYEHLEYVVTMLGLRVDQTLVDGKGNPQVMGAPLMELCRVPGSQFVGMFGKDKAETSLLVPG